MHTIDEIRRIRLKALANECGSQKALAEKIQKTPAQVSALINGSKDSKTGKPRGMHDDTAREIEAKCGKPRGWLDSLGESAISSQLVGLNPEAVERIIDSLHRIGKGNLLEAAAFLEVMADRIGHQGNQSKH